ncbi:hypothetical protein CJD36_012535 [Flavipsychrobacter stenotrophus]|uniref:Uncharacterized protein n=1 Tax=Flavipsychrobacter stenotrophus TaxID=2077091 RepID=A0A2S7SV49_9BACT|nr:hypothetical protein [Flavipsychrobacter stenotrophus]PQJ10790.1 hypothetical protein CJD36_012535 [Flavipsychrobacter stenotrophus]
MNTLITYDIVENIHKEAKQTQVKETMKANGYLDHFTKSGDSTNAVHYLPNTSLVKIDTTPEQAKIDLDAAVKKHGATLERCFAVGFEQGKYVAIPGKAYAK